jgi:hypothetical protein
MTQLVHSEYKYLTAKSSLTNKTSHSFILPRLIIILSHSFVSNSHKGFSVAKDEGHKCFSFGLSLILWRVTSERRAITPTYSSNYFTSSAIGLIPPVERDAVEVTGGGTKVTIGARKTKTKERKKSKAKGKKTKAKGKKTKAKGKKTKPNSRKNSEVLRPTKGCKPKNCKKCGKAGTSASKGGKKTVANPLDPSPSVTSPSHVALHLSVLQRTQKLGSINGQQKSETLLPKFSVSETEMTSNQPRFSSNG